MENKYSFQTSILQQQQVVQQQQFAERILEHLAFNNDILERWHQIGSSQGLMTDLEVATFLIQHYENTWDRATPTGFCQTCHSPLTLTCTKCSTPTPTTTPTPNNNTAVFSPNTSTNVITSLNSLSQFFDPTTSLLDPTVLKSGKKGGKKTKKIKTEGMGKVSAVTSLAAVGDGQTTDEDLIGLYGAWFPQSQVPAQPAQPVSSQVITLPIGNSSNGDGRLKCFICTQCGKTFYKNSDFRKHERIHNNDRPFKCEYCPSAFSDSSSAVRHRRVHTGEKPFKCSICSASFAQSSDRTKHMRVHTKLRPWVCPVCDRAFSDSSSFSKHKRKHEKTEPKKKGKKKKKGKGGNFNEVNIIQQAAMAVGLNDDDLIVN